MPGGGFIGNYFDIDDDEFVNLRTPPAGCDLDDDPDECVIAAELRGPLLGLDEDEGANFLSNGGRSIYHSLQLSLQRRFSRGYMFNVNYTLSRSRDTFSDEGIYQIEHDQTKPDLNFALSDFDRRHRLILSWTWELPMSGNGWVEGWQLSGVGTFQSGRPFSITDEDGSGFLFASQNPRPDLAPGATLDDQTTEGSVESRVDTYLNRDAFVRTGAQFGTLGRNSVTGPGQRAHRCQPVEDDADQRAGVAGAATRGLQRDRHADLPESGERSGSRQLRRHHAQRAAARASCSSAPS